MADDNKLWFEMGVRDNVTNSLGKILELTKALGGEMDKVVATAGMLGKIDKVKFENGQAVRNALNYQNMLITIDNMMEKINGRKVTATVGVDKLDQATANLEQFRDQLLRLQEISGDNWNGDMLRTQQTAMRNVLNVVNELLREQAVEQKNDAAATSQNAKANRELVSAYDNIIEKGKGTNSVLRQMEIQLASTFSLYGAEHLLKSVIQIGGEFEQQHIALQNILGDIEQANTLFNQIQTLAVVSPFNFRQLTSYAKQTAAYGIPYEELYDTTKRLADLSAGLGVDMGRLILAYGQVRSASVLRGQELRQFTEAGIPLVQKLADKFTELQGRVVQTGEVFELISKRKVPFEMVKEVLWDMTDAGGAFYQMQFKLSDTLLGKWSNLQDAWEIMLSKFAEGGSTGGDTLKWLVQGATDLIESLDRLSPMITGIIGGVAFSKFAKFATGDILNTKKAIIDAKKLEASRLRRDALTRSLSDREKEILATSDKITVNDVKALASAGRLNTLKLQQLYVSKQLTNSDVARLVNEKAITVEQGAQITNATRLKVLLGSLRATASGILSGIWATLTNPAFLLTAGISAAMSAIAAWKEAEAEREEIAEAVGNSIVDQYNQVLKVQQDIAKSNPISDGDYLKGINDMTETLKGIGAYSGEVDNQARSIENLAERYAYLKKKIDEASEAYANLSKHAQTSTDYAISATDGWFDESIVTNMKDLTNTMEDYDKAAIKIQRYGSIIQEQINKMADFAGNEKLKKLIDGKSMEEQLKIIAESGYWQGLENLVGQTSTKAKDALVNFNEAYFEVLADWNTITGEDLPEFIQGIEDSFKREHPDIDLTNLDDEMKLELKRFVHQALTEVDGVRQDIKDRLEQDIDAHFKINVDFELSISTPPDYWRVKYPVLNQLMGKLGEKGINMDNNFYNSIGEAGGASSSDKLWKHMDKQVDDLKVQWQAEEKLYGAASEQAEKAKTSYENMKSARDAAFGGSMKDAKKSPGRGNKKDEELEEIKNRVDLYKKFFSELENAKKMYGTKGGLDFLKENGFEAVFGWGLSDVTDYRISLSELTKELDGSTEARRKFLNTTDADKVAQKRKEEAEALREYVSELQRMMSVMSDNYQTYKKWVELTGDAELAARLAGVTQNSSYADYLREAMKKELDKSNLDLSPDDVFGLDYKGIRNLGENSAFYALWDEWRKNQQKLKKEQLDLYEDAIKNSKTYGDKIDDINRKLAKQIEAVSALAKDDEERKRLIEGLTENASKEISKVRWEEFKDKNNWGEVFGDLESLPLKQLKKMIKAMREFGKTANLNTTETKAWHEAMSKLTNREAVIDPVNAIKDALKSYRDAQSKTDSLEGMREIVRRGFFKTQYESEEELQKAIDDSKKNEQKALVDLQKAIKALSSNITKLGNSFEQIGNTIGGTFGDVMNGFGAVFGGFGKSFDAISSVDVNAKGIAGIAGKVSAVVTVFSAMIDMNKKLHELLPSTESLYEHYAQKQREINEAREAIDDYAVAVIKRAQKEKDWLYKNDLTNLRNGGYLQGKLLENYTNTAIAEQVIYEEARAGISKWAGAIIGAIVGAVITIVTWGSGGPLGVAAGTAIANVIGGVAATAVGAAVATGAGAALGQAMQSAAESIVYREGYTSARQNMRVQTRHSTFFRSEKTQNLEDWVREHYGTELFGWDFHGYKLIDLDIAKQLLEDGPTLVGETRETLERFVEITEQIQEIQDQAHEYVSQSFSPLVDNMTDSLWDWLSDGKNMMDSFYDYASDTFANIAKDAVKAFLKINLMDKFTEPLNDIFEAYSFGLIDEGVMMLGVANIAGQIGTTFEQLTPTLQQLGTVLADAFKIEGYDITGKSSKSSSGSSTVRSMSEGTADIIVGYINSIRADTSVNRITLAQILVAVQVQSEMPAIARQQLEELSKISANTATIATNTAKIGEIYDIINKNVVGANYFHVK